MTQRQKTPSTGSGTPTSADDLAGNKVAEMMGDKAAKALDAIDNAQKTAQAPKRLRKIKKMHLCGICGHEWCPLTVHYEVEVEA